jgi:hypothetical protein
MQIIRLFPILCLMLIAALAAIWLGDPGSILRPTFDRKTLPCSTSIRSSSVPTVASLLPSLPSQPDFLEAIEGLRLDSEKAGVDSVVRMLAAQDPATVESILQKVPDREMCGYLLNRVAIQWATRNPSGTAGWLLHLPAQVERTQALISAGRVWAETDPRAAARYAASFPAGPLRQQVITASVSVWISQDLPAAAAWINRFPPGPDFDSVVAQIARAPALIGTDTSTALNWAESISDDAGRSQCISLILAHWAERDPVAVVQYVTNTLALSSDQRIAILAHFHLRQ